MENFICHMYGGGRESEVNVNELRYKIYCQQSGKIGINMLPPAMLECFDTACATSKLSIQDFAPIPRT